MAIYKGIEVENGLQHLLPHMQSVESYRESLQTLQAVWDNLNLLGHLSGTTTEMNNTRAAFSVLTSNLLNNLARSTLARCVQDISAKAQVSIDILIRNLFERTADIGFLATDDSIRQFIQKKSADPTLADSEIRARLKAYIEKYSVYFDVVLLSAHGDVLARILPLENIERCTDRFIQAALSSDAPYVESYGDSSLFTQRASRLIYAYRVNDPSGRPIGVLCLCFDLPDEMERIFSGLTRANDWSVITLLDEKNTVIASSDPYLIPVGARLDAVDGDGSTLRFAGRRYLASRRSTQGYQGYNGPGWRAVVLLPLEYAFAQEDSAAENKPVNPALFAAILASDRAFPPELKSIPVQAEAIQRELERSVWNGNIRQSRHSQENSNPAFSKILLSEISHTGLRMKSVFAQSIGKLQETVIASLLDDCRFLSKLAIDIMDRNLYERANDCRWWALDPVLCDQLADKKTTDRAAQLARRLSAINDLYTVYDSLILFDESRRIVATSRPHVSGHVGKVLEDTWSQEALNIDNPAHYVVSPLTPTFLYDGRPSYIYATSLKNRKGETAGGIGIVFDSEPQFAAMLKDALPAHQPEAFGLYIDVDRRIIASSDSRFKVGDVINLPEELLSAAKGSEGESRLIVFNKQVMSVGVHQSSGYREYKSAQDTYQNDVFALIFIPLGEYGEAAIGSPVHAEHPEMALTNQGGKQPVGICIEIASFMVGPHWLGLPVKEVIEAVELVGFTRIPNAPPQVFGSMIYQSAAIPLYNLHAALGLEDSAHPEEMQVIVICSEEGTRFGLLVDQLSEIPEVPVENIEPVNNIFVGITPVLASIVKSPSGSGNMLTLLSVASMVGLLKSL